ncbi:MAG TPA: hypothetical protein VGJ72_15555, partial [Polaromonas sp.]
MIVERAVGRPAAQALPRTPLTSSGVDGVHFLTPASQPEGNVIEPGPIDTDMNPADGDFSAMQKAGTALGRYG